MDRLILNAQDTITNVFLEEEMEDVKAELKSLGNISGDFRSTARVRVAISSCVDCPDSSEWT
jgi:hypothetical protein